MDKEAKGGRPSAYRWLVFALLAAGYFLVYFHRLAPAVVAVDMMKDFHAGGGLIGLLASAYFYPYALMQIPSGLLADSWGPRRTITLFFCLAGVASIGLGLAQGIGLAIFARVLVGVGVAMLFVGTMKVLTRWFAAREFATMMGILMAVGGLGVLGAFEPLAYLSNYVGWRGSFIVIGVATLALAVVIWLCVRNSPEEMGLAGPKRSAAEAQAAGGEPIGLAQGMKMVLGSWRFWPLAVWFFITPGIFFSFAGLWGGPYLMQVYGLSKPHAGRVMNMMAWAMIVGSPLLSLLSDRVLHSRKKVLIGASGLLLLLSIPLAFFPAGMTVNLLYGWCFLFSIATSAVVVVAFTMSKELFPVQIAGTATGLVNLSPFLGGAILQPVLGLVLEAYGSGAGGYPPQAYGRAFLIYFVAAIVGLVAACLTKETLRPQS